MDHIHKAAGILIRDKRLLITRSRGKEIFIPPGGKIEQGESAKQALIRELNEELGIIVRESNFEEFGSFAAPAAGNETKMLEMQVFLVTSWEGEIIPNNEIEEIRWITSDMLKNIQIGSILEREVLPRLKSANLIN